MNLVGKYIPFSDEKPLDGIFNFYNHELKRKLYEIYAIPNSEFISSSDHPEYITYRNLTDFTYFCTDTGHPSIIFHFQYPILVNQYSIENARLTSPKEPHGYPIKWVFEGSNDNYTWIPIDSQDNQCFCPSPTSEFPQTCKSTSILSYTIKYSNYYTYLKITSQKNSLERDYILMSSFELFGEVKFPRRCTKILGKCIPLNLITLLYSTIIYT